jgi:hypothetical protein
MPFSPLAQPVFSPRAHGDDEVRMRDADDDIENRPPNPVNDAESQASVGSRASSSRHTSVTGSLSSDQTPALHLSARPWGAQESLLQGSKDVQQARQTAPAPLAARQERLRP